MTPTEQDKELQEWLVEHTALIEETGGAVWRELEVETFMYHLRELITADRKRVALEARIDTATDILYGFSRTYKQEVTDSAGNVYIDESHGYISRYEVQELVAELKAQQEEV